MNISSIGGAGGTTAVGPNQNDFRSRMEQSVAPVAQLFGMSSDQLMTAVKASGESLADYAASKGVSSPDLTAAIKQGLQDNAPNGVQLSDSQLTNLVQRIENHKPGDRPQGPPPGGAVGATTSTIKSELEKLLEDLKASDSTTADGTSNTTAAVSTNALLDVQTRFDRQL